MFSGGVSLLCKLTLLGASKTVRGAHYAEIIRKLREAIREKSVKVI